MSRFLAVLLLLASLALAVAADDPPPDPIIGKWLWQTGNHIILNNKNQLLFGDKNVGTWTLVNAGPPRVYRLDWKLSSGPEVDTLTLTEDGLEGKDQAGNEISAEKLPNRLPWRDER